MNKKLPMAGLPKPTAAPMKAAKAPVLKKAEEMGDKPTMMGGSASKMGSKSKSSTGTPLMRPAPAPVAAPAPKKFTPVAQKAE
jgi:hypothetical protein